MKYEKLVESVDNPMPYGPRKIARVLILCSGDVTPVKVRIANMTIADWIMNKKLETKVEPGECPYPMPSSTNTYLKTFFSSAKCYYGWVIGSKNCKGFPGSVAAVLSTIYALRAEQWVRLYCYLLMEDLMHY